MSSFTTKQSIMPGSSGILMPRYRARLVTPEGEDINGYDEAGELLLQSPTLFKGYVGDEDASKAAFESPGWLRTGDVAMFRPAADGTEHLFVVDRLKDMVKVKVRLHPHGPARGRRIWRWKLDEYSDRINFRDRKWPLQRSSRVCGCIRTSQMWLLLPCRMIGMASGPRPLSSDLRAQLERTKRT